MFIALPLWTLTFQTCWQSGKIQFCWRSQQHNKKEDHSFFWKTAKISWLIFGDTYELNSLHTTHLVTILSTPTKTVLYLFKCVKPTRVGLMFGTFDRLGRKSLTALDTVNRFVSDISGGFILRIWMIWVQNDKAQAKFKIKLGKGIAYFLP